MVVESRHLLPMDEMRPDVLPQRSPTIRPIRERCSRGSGSSGPNFFYGGAADLHAAEFFEDQRPVFLAWQASDD